MIERVAAGAGRLAAILDDQAEPLIAFTGQRTILAANRAAEALFGYGRGELCGQSTDILVPVRMRQPDAPPMQATDTLTTVELPGLRRDGTEPQLAWTFGAIVGPEPVFVLTMRDRAEIEAALEALYTSEQRFRLLVDGVRDHAMILLDPDGRVASWNSGAESIQGWRADEVVGSPYEMFFTAADRAAGVPARNLAAAARDGSNQVAGWRMRKDGSQFFAEASIWPLRDPDGALQGFAKITHDLTAKRAAEEAQRRFEIERAAREAAEAGRDRLARVHRAAQALSRATRPQDVVAAVLQECLLELDAGGGAVYVLREDAAALRLVGGHGYPAGFLDGFATIPLDQRNPACDAVRTMTALFFENAAAGAAAYPHHAAELRRSGFEAAVALPLVVRSAAVGVLVARYRQARTFPESDRWLLLTMAELCAQALDRARLFTAEIEARAEAEAASRAKDEFLAMLGHELRNPLAPIATAVELMKLRGETHSRREREVIERQLGHITRLVDDLLDISRITRGKLDLARAPVDVADVVARAVEMASPLLEQRRHQLALELARELLVNADAARLAQVIANLLSNAARYTPAGGRIGVQARAEGPEVVIDVQDNGDGISAELLPRVFDLFVQGRRSFDRSDGGLGIGLALVKNIVGMHGGRVSASSAGVPGQGSRFSVRLPRLPQASATSGPTSATHALRSARAGKRVLVVDDNRDFAEMLSASLRTLGYDVATALDGVTALDRLRDFPAEVAVLDLGLPVLDGFELARQIRERFPTRTPRLIAVTGYGQPHDRERTAAVGFARHLVKPIDMAAVIAALEDQPPSASSSKNSVPS